MQFLSQHRESCESCFAYGEEVSTISRMIRSARIESGARAGFSDNVADAVIGDRAALVRSLRPAFVGAIAAVLAVGAAVQFASASPSADVVVPGTSVERHLRPVHSNPQMRIELFDSPSRMVRDPEPFDA